VAALRIHPERIHLKMETAVGSERNGGPGWT
jgi:hypothetical protein